MDKMTRLEELIVMIRNLVEQEADQDKKYHRLYKEAEASRALMDKLSEMRHTLETEALQIIRDEADESL